MALFKKGNSNAQSKSSDESSAEPAPPAPVDSGMAVAGEDWQREVAIAAYYRWLARGGEEGQAEKDWYDAEAEIASKGKQPGGFPPGSP